MPVAACSHSASVGRRAPAQRANASASYRLRWQGPAFLDFRHLNRPAQAPGVEIIEIVSGAGLHAAAGQPGYSNSPTRATAAQAPLGREIGDEAGWGRG